MPRTLAPALALVSAALAGCDGWHPLYTLAQPTTGGATAPSPQEAPISGALVQWQANVSDTVNAAVSGATVTPKFGYGQAPATITFQVSVPAGYRLDHYESRTGFHALGLPSGNQLVTVTTGSPAPDTVHFVVMLAGNG